MIPALPDRRYPLLYADPPWLFRTWSPAGEGRSPARHYACLDMTALADLPVGTLAAENAVLFLWVYDPMLPDALQLIEAWGFRFVTVGFVWVKKVSASLRDGLSPFRIGTGYHTRKGCEQCWIAVKGRGYARLSRGEPQVIHAPLREHSRKPDAVAESIVRLVGDVPRLELFARTQRPGWDCWGNETERFAAAGEAIA